MSKLIMLKGLPASGKSTRAKEIVGYGNYVRVNRDLLREMLHFGVWSGRNEDVIVHAEKDLALLAFARGKNVVVDDCNLNPKNEAMWRGFVDEAKNAYQATFEVESIKTPLYQCIMRDEVRDKAVGAHVIMNMALQYGYDETPNKEIIICDIDGTVADLKHRRHYVEGEKKDWKGFYSELEKDTPIEKTRELLATLRTVDMPVSEHDDIEYIRTVIFVSGRPEDYRLETEKWLREHGFGFYWTLIMRPKGDSRQDTIVKQEIYDRYLKNKQIYKVIDDRPSVIRMWKANGLDVIDVGDQREF